MREVWYEYPRRNPKLLCWVEKSWGSGFTLTSPVKLAKKQYQLTGRIPIVDQGEQFIAGYTDNEKISWKDEYIIFGDHSEHIKFVDFLFVQGADGLKILKPKRGYKRKISILLRL